jgi:hypothetical protein
MKSKLHSAGPPEIPIEGCTPVPVKANADDRGCLFEIFREEWAGAFKTVQWNALRSLAGVMRGVHVHVDYDEFYTLPLGRVFIALRDIRRASPTFGKSIGLEWSTADGLPFPYLPALRTQFSSWMNRFLPLGSAAIGGPSWMWLAADGMISTRRCVGPRKAQCFQIGTGRQDRLPICSRNTRRCLLVWQTGRRGFNASRTTRESISCRVMP